MTNIKSIPSHGAEFSKESVQLTNSQTLPLQWHIGDSVHFRILFSDIGVFQSVWVGMHPNFHVGMIKDGVFGTEVDIPVNITDFLSGFDNQSNFIHGMIQGRSLEAITVYLQFTSTIAKKSQEYQFILTPNEDKVFSIPVEVI